MATTMWHVGQEGSNILSLQTNLELNGLKLNSSSYSTDEFRSQLTRTGDILAGIHLVLVCILTTVGNLLIIILSKKDWRSFKPIDKLIVNIAVSDLLTGLFGYPLPMLSSFRHRWDFGLAGCTWYSFLAFTGGTVSMVSISFVAIFRYIKISQSTSEYQRSFNRNISFAIAFSWIYAVAWSAFPLIGWGRYTLEPFHTSCTVDWTSVLPGDRIYIVTIMIAVFGLPLGLIITCYVAIARKLYRHQLQFRQRGNRNLSTFNIQFRNENRLIVTALVVTSCCLITWTPYAIASMILIAIGDNANLSAPVSFFPAMFAKTSTIYNPIIYFILNKNFRKDAIKMLCRCGCKLFHFNVNIREEWCENHSGGIKIIISGRRVNYRVVCGHPICRQVRRADSSEADAIPLRDLQKVSIKHCQVCEDNPEVSTPNSHLKRSVRTVSAHVASCAKEREPRGHEEAHASGTYSSSLISPNDLPGQPSRTLENRTSFRRLPRSTIPRQCPV